MVCFYHTTAWSNRARQSWSKIVSQNKKFQGLWDGSLGKVLVQIWQLGFKPQEVHESGRRGLNSVSSAFYMYYGTYMLPCTHQTHKRASKKNSEWISKALSSHQRSFSVLWQVVKCRNSQVIKVQGRRVPHMGHPCHLPGSGTTGEEWAQRLSKPEVRQDWRETVFWTLWEAAPGELSSQAAFQHREGRVPQVPGPNQGAVTVRGSGRAGAHFL